MTINYYARVENPFGEHIKTFRTYIDPTDGGGAGLDYILNVGKPSSCLLTLPITEDLEIFQVDTRILPLRSIHGRAPYNDNSACYFVRKHTITDSWFRVSAKHAMDLIDRRAVAYEGGSAFADKPADFAGDMIKEYLRQNIGDQIDASREGDQTNADLVTPGYLTIEADKGDGQSNPKTSERGSLLGVIDKIADNSTQQDTYMSFGMIYGGDKTFTFITKEGQWGADKREGTRGQVILDPEKGNLGNWKLEIDRSDEVTVAIAGGRGQNETRIIQVAIDTARMNASPFNRIERYFDAPSADTEAAVLAAAEAALASRAPKVTFEADYIETNTTTRGIHFDLGDLVTCRVRVGRVVYQFDVRLDTIYVSVRSSGQRSRIQLSNNL